jgi:hypothetical protein
VCFHHTTVTTFQGRDAISVKMITRIYVTAASERCMVYTLVAHGEMPGGQGQADSIVLPLG